MSIISTSRGWGVRIRRFQGHFQLYNSLSYMSDLVRVPIAVIHIWTKATWRRKVLLLFILPVISPLLREVRAKTQAGQEPRGGNWSRFHGRVLLTGLFFMVCSTYLFRAPRTTSTGKKHPQWTGLPHQSSKSWQTFPQANLVGVFSPLKIPFLKWP